MTQLQKLTDAVAVLATISVDANTETELTEFATLARAGSRQIEHLILQIACRTNTLHAQGRSGSAGELLAEGGYVSTATAKKEARRAETAESLPQLRQALSAGLLSGEHLDVVARTTNSLSDEQRLHLDTDALTAAATHSSPDQFANTVRNLVDQAKQDWGLGRAIEERQKSELRTWRDLGTGMGRFSGWLDPERFDALQLQLNTETASLAANRKSEGDTLAKDEFLAIDALLSLIEKGTGALGRPTMIVHVDGDTVVNGPHGHSLRETDSGHQVPPETIQRFLCDAVIQPVLMKDGLALNVGRKARTATDAQWAALRAMYDSCAWQGCAAQVNWCQAHHITFWEPSSHSSRPGRTDLGNLIPLCSHHHHQVHEGHWQLHLAPDRTLTIKTPGGTTWKTTKPGRQQQVSSHTPGSISAKGPPGAARQLLVEKSVGGSLVDTHAVAKLS